MAPDYYAILEIGPEASIEDIKKQYRFLAHAFHPDKFSTPEHKKRAEDRLKEINTAYAVLTDPEQRSRYDSIRHSEAHAEQARRDAQARRHREQAEREAEQRRHREQAEREAEQRRHREHAEREAEQRRRREHAEHEAEQRRRREHAEREAKERLKAIGIETVITLAVLTCGLILLAAPSAFPSNSSATKITGAQTTATRTARPATPTQTIIAAQANTPTAPAATQTAEECRARVTASIAQGDYNDFHPGTNLAGCDLSGLDLVGLDLSEADLRKADLRGADLRNTRLARADLRGALLVGVNVLGTDFTQARMADAVMDTNPASKPRSAPHNAPKSLWTRSCAATPTRCYQSLGRPTARTLPAPEQTAPWRSGMPPMRKSSPHSKDAPAQSSLFFGPPIAHSSPVAAPTAWCACGWWRRTCREACSHPKHPKPRLFHRRIQTRRNRQPQHAARFDGIENAIIPQSRR